MYLGELKWGKGNVNVSHTNTVVNQQYVSVIEYLDTDPQVARVPATTRLTKIDTHILGREMVLDLLK